MQSFRYFNNNGRSEIGRYPFEYSRGVSLKLADFDAAVAYVVVVILEQNVSGFA
jgi:hypothetical protein